MGLIKWRWPLPVSLLRVSSGWIRGLSVQGPGFYSCPGQSLLMTSGPGGSGCPPSGTSLHASWGPVLHPGGV